MVGCESIAKWYHYDSFRWKSGALVPAQRGSASYVVEPWMAIRQLWPVASREVM
jgi:hypothetical protein